ncbi:MAG TPA: PEP-CTERM sorting domain-containing protein, partial [Vicinamibacterales bacterium]
TISGSLVYDPSAPALPPEQPGFTQYRPAGALTLGLGSGLVLPLEGMIVTESYFVNGFLQQAFVGAFGATDNYPGFDFIRSELEFRGGDRKGTALPTSASDFLTRYPDGFIRFTAWQTGVNPPFDSGTQEFFGTIQPTPVPEPGTLLLAGAGLAMLARRRRRLRAGARRDAGKSCNAQSLAA